MTKRILTDAGFWIALLDIEDQHHDEASALLVTIETQQLLIPWCVLYEVFRTRFVRKPARVRQFEQLLIRPNVEILNESDYQESALRQVFSFARPNLSLVDCVLRGILRDPVARIATFATFNRPDFEDVCQPRNIQLLP